MTSSAMTKAMTKRAAAAITGGLSNPSKMPGKAFSLPAFACLLGSILRKIPGSVCSRCYALKGRYLFPVVQRALQRRLTLLNAVLASGRRSAAWKLWLQAMKTLIGTDTHFRFHDSGDLQSVDHLELYCDLAQTMPDTMFWLPTREVRILRRYLGRYPKSGMASPPNLIIRASALMIDKPADIKINGEPWPWTSEVWSKPYTDPETGTAFALLCPAPSQNNSCGDCRACWDRTVPTVAYVEH